MRLMAVGAPAFTYYLIKANFAPNKKYFNYLLFIIYYLLFINY